MARIVAIGEQNFEVLVQQDSFYVDKTNFIKEWWEGRDSVTLITRPRRFGKTLTMHMVERFFSIKHKGGGELFERLNIWKDEKYRQLQGMYPVINLSFANVKGSTYEESIAKINSIFSGLYIKNEFLKKSGLLAESEMEYFDRIMWSGIRAADTTDSLYHLCDFMQRYYGRKVIVLLDEYDTPMQEAYVCGYWNEIVSFIRKLFHSAFKTNPYLEKAIMTGITRVSKESVFSDLNNLEVVTSTSNKYADSFGFTQVEVSKALREFGLADQESIVKDWYDGFTFGNKKDIYNPWSIINFLDKKELDTYWVNTSGNGLINELIRKGSKEVKYIIEDLIKGNTLHTKIDEQIIFGQLESDENAIWSLFLASGYLKAEHCQFDVETGDKEYDLKLTNKEVLFMFRKMIRGWFQNKTAVPYNDFIKAMLSDNLFEMNRYMNDIALTTFSFFDSGAKPSKITELERFYHGFVLGMMVDMAKSYVITSNRESGYGRYDVMLEPKEWKESGNPAIVMEFKVSDPENESTLQETVQSALLQMKEKNYAAALLAKGIPGERIREYGFAFEGKKVLIGGGHYQHGENV